MKSIKETRELVDALASIAIRLIRDLEDGKVSIAEGIAFFSDFNVLRVGLSGIGEIPSELADLDDEEQETLLADISAALVSAGLSHRVSDASSKILRWAYGSVRTFLDIRNAPPSAILVEPLAPSGSVTISSGGTGGSHI